MNRKLFVRLASLAVIVLATIVVLARASDDADAAAHPLRICVDRAGAAFDPADAQARIERVVRQMVLTHPMSAQAGYDGQSLTVTSGCPEIPALLASGERHFKNGGSLSVSSLHLGASGYRTFVYVVPQAEIDRMFGSLPFRVAPQEITCEGDGCGEIATAFYVSPETLAASDGIGRLEVARGLIHATGLEPIVPFTTNGGTQHK